MTRKGNGTKRQNLSTSAPGIRPCPKFRWRFRASFFRAARFLDLSDLIGYDITVMVPNALRVSALEYRAEPTGEGSQNTRYGCYGNKVAPVLFLLLTGKRQPGGEFPQGAKMVCPLRSNRGFAGGRPALACVLNSA